MASSSPRQRFSATWSTLPAELRAIIIRLAFDGVRGDPDEEGSCASCAKLAKARLNMVSREFEGIASPMQWHHLELSPAKDVGVFVDEVLSKHGSDCRKLSLIVSKKAASHWPRGHLAALEALEYANHPRPSREIHTSDALFHALFRHTFTVATAVESVRMSHYDDWSHCIVPGYSSMPIGPAVRKLEVCGDAVHRPPQLGQMLHLVRLTLEELRLDVSHRLSVPFASAYELFPSWPAQPQDEPRFPRLGVLVSPEYVLVTASATEGPPMSNVLRQLEIVPLVPRPTRLLAAFVTKHSASLENVTMDERFWEAWTWTTVRSWGPRKMDPVRQECIKHNIAFRWLLVRTQHNCQYEDVECPADLIGLVDLV